LSRDLSCDDAEELGARCLDSSALTALIPKWEARAAACDAATVFSGPLFQNALADAFFPEVPRRTIGLFRGDEMAGLLPLCPLPLRKGPFILHETGFFRNAHTLRNHLLTDADANHVRRLLQAALDATDADTLLLQNLPCDGNLLECCFDQARELGYCPDVPGDGRALMFCDVEGSYDDYLATRSGQFRRQLRKRRRELEAQGAFSIAALSGPRIVDALAAWKAVVAASWQGQEGEEQGELSDATWHFHSLLAASGQLWLASLGDRPVAALRMLEDRRAVYVHTMNFDQSLRGFAPGLVIFDAMMRDAFDRGIRRVDFNGASHFFSRWATDRLAHGSLRIYRKTLSARVGRIARQLIAARRRDGPVPDTAA